MPTAIPPDKDVVSVQATRALPVESLKKAIAYYYLLTFCPPERILDGQPSLAPMRKAISDSAQMSEQEFINIVVPEVCRRIVAFHENSREPSQELISRLVNLASVAELSPDQADKFQQEMVKIASLPPRARPENRLHRKKGCQFCQSPCSYGYFTLVSEPPFTLLNELFAAEANKAIPEQTPLNPMFHFTLGHLEGLAGMKVKFIDIRHMVNLSYCLLILGITKSRLAIPEQQLHIFQDASREFIRRSLVQNQAK
jgi:hypothetical protein